MCSACAPCVRTLRPARDPTTVSARLETIYTHAPTPCYCSAPLVYGTRGMSAHSSVFRGWHCAHSTKKAVSAIVRAAVKRCGVAAASAKLESNFADPCTKSAYGSILRPTAPSWRMAGDCDGIIELTVWQARHEACLLATCLLLCHVFTYCTLPVYYLLCGILK